MEPMFLRSVENNADAKGAYADLIRTVQAAGGPVSQIWHLFAYKPEITKHLERFAQGVMRGPSPLSPGLRELIAAYTSVRNQCPF
jgi:hypothetical protein